MERRTKRRMTSPKSSELGSLLEQMKTLRISSMDIGDITKQMMSMKVASPPVTQPKKKVRMDDINDAMNAMKIKSKSPVRMDDAKTMPVDELANMMQKTLKIAKKRKVVVAKPAIPTARQLAMKQAKELQALKHAEEQKRIAAKKDADRRRRQAKKEIKKQADDLSSLFDLAKIKGGRARK